MVHEDLDGATLFIVFDGIGDEVAEDFVDIGRYKVGHNASGVAHVDGHIYATMFCVVDIGAGDVGHVFGNGTALPLFGVRAIG